MIEPIPFKGILFDKDGTLFDFEASWASWMANLLLRFSEGDRTHAGRAGRNLGFDLDSLSYSSNSPVIAGSPASIVTCLIEQFPRIDPQRIIDTAFESSATAPQVEAVPLPPLLSELRGASMRLGIATNDSEEIARLHIEAAGILDFFDFIAGYDSGFGEKPEPGMMIEFCRATGIQAAEAVMVGDSPHDMMAGRIAGMATVGVLTGIADYHDLAPMADAVLESIADLPAWISGTGNRFGPPDRQQPEFGRM